ncbi:hypothetical protein [Parasphingorhabdus sp.]|jgi:hypothetical protein|uniref:hypothetical protein n=1 Tax=Parasphingorhabdus sp. TaxID=2709688 RepID=UPI0007F42DFF|nr:hypothetical protein A8B75_05690 [Sphingomonadales bacterium EhC05]
MTKLLTPTIDPKQAPIESGIETGRRSIPAAGLFGFAISESPLPAFKPSAGYLRDMEQMPNFAPPSVASFVAQYVASNIGKDEDSS